MSIYVDFQPLPDITTFELAQIVKLSTLITNELAKEAYPLADGKLPSIKYLLSLDKSMTRHLRRT
jgi:hypothetical protein